MGRFGKSSPRIIFITIALGRGIPHKICAGVLRRASEAFWRVPLGAKPIRNDALDARRGANKQRKQTNNVARDVFLVRLFIWL